MGRFEEGFETTNELPAELTADRIGIVVIRCRAFDVIFSVAPLRAEA